MTTIHERIKEVRLSQGKMTQAEFAEKMGMTRDRYKNYEYGKVEVDGMLINLVCKTFHVNQRWLETGEGEMYEENDSLSPREVQMMLRGSFSDEQIAWAITMLQQPTEVLQGMTQMLRDYAEELNRIKRDRE